MEKKKVLTLIGVYSILFIFSIALIAVGANQYVNYTHTLPIELIQNNCQLNRQELIGCSDGTWVVVWNGNIVEDVYSHKPTEDLAIRAMNNYAMNSTYPCLCNQVPKDIDLNCSLWNSCYLNINVTKSNQWAGTLFKYGSDSSLAIGILMFITLLTTSMVMCIKKRTTLFDYTRSTE